jgi:hypothetical protein
MQQLIDKRCHNDNINIICFIDKAVIVKQLYSDELSEIYYDDIFEDYIKPIKNRNKNKNKTNNNKNDFIRRIFALFFIIFLFIIRIIALLNR